MDLQKSNWKEVIQQIQTSEVACDFKYFFRKNTEPLRKDFLMRLSKREAGKPLFELPFYYDAHQQSPLGISLLFFPNNIPIKVKFILRRYGFLSIMQTSSC